MSPIRPEDRHRYPSRDEWARIRTRILERARGRCECTGRCGHDHGGRCDEIDRHPALYFRGRVVLTLAHLDHQPENNADENLAALCQRCHLAYDRDHHAATRAATRRAELEASGQTTIGEAP